MVGFHADPLYWTDAMNLTHRWALAGGEPVRVRAEDARVGDRSLGRSVVLERGRVVSTLRGTAPGVGSPDGRRAVDVQTSRLRLTDARTGRRTPLQHLDRSSAFGGWLPDGSFYALTHRFRDADPTSATPRPGRLVRCSTATGECSTSVRIPDARFAVVPGSMPY